MSDTAQSEMLMPKRSEPNRGIHPKPRLPAPSAIVVIGGLSVLSWAAVLSVIVALRYDP
jgi:hypothetical protein